MPSVLALTLLHALLQLTLLILGATVLLCSFRQPAGRRGPALTAGVLLTAAPLLHLLWSVLLLPHLSEKDGLRNALTAAFGSSSQLSVVLALAGMALLAMAATSSPRENA